MKNKILTIGFTAVLVVLLAMFIVLPDNSVSYAERRKLATLPKLTAEAVFSGSYFTDFESYALDQFPLREVFRSVQAIVKKDIFRQLDSGGVYAEGGELYKINYPLDEHSVIRAGELCARLSGELFPEASIYCAVIPEHSGYISGIHPQADFSALSELFAECLPNAAYIDLRGVLDSSCYYATDLHWKQEKLLPAADALLAAMGNSYRAEGEQFTPRVLAPFYGGYYHQAALPYIAPDSLVYLESELISACTVYDVESGAATGVYEPAAFRGIDPYDVFLGGAKAVLEIENPFGGARELVLFRDSFGSSLAPLLLGGYGKITLIDLRYIKPEFIGEYVKLPKQCDVLFLYSEQILNKNALY